MRHKNLASISIYLLQLFVLVLSLTALFTASALASEAEPVPPTLPIRLVIPKIDLDSVVIPVGVKEVVIDGKSYKMWETADNEVGWHNLSAPLGQVGNTVLAGHSDVKAMVFRNLQQLEVGDELLAFSAADKTAHRYVVAQKLLVQEKGASVETRIQNAQWVAPTSDERLTLVTCAGPDAAHRLIVIAYPVGK
jgi:LPXTG-site transpeptidase (sortase) family protein